MSLVDAQIQFAAEFVTLMVSAAGLALVVLRPPDGRTGGALLLRAVAFVGLGAGGTASFLHGSLLVTGNHVKWIGLAHVAGAAVLLPVLPRWWQARARNLGRILVVFGLIVWAVAGVVEFFNWVPTRPNVPAGLLAAGALAVGVSLLTLGRRAIAVRVAAGAATTLFLVILALALALASVISSSVQREALNRLASRAGIETTEVADTVGTVDSTVKFAGADLEAYFSGRSPNPISSFASGNGSEAQLAGQSIDTRLLALARLGGVGSLAYVDPNGTDVLAASSSTPTFDAFARVLALQSQSCAKGSSGLFVYGGQAWSAAAYPECSTSSQLLGVVVDAEPLDATYLSGRHAIDNTVTLTLVSRRSVLASAGSTPPPSELARILSEPGHSKPISSSFLSATTLSVAHGQPPLSLVLSSAATTVTSTRNSLYRTLFLIALGGTVLALGFAIFIGDRITDGLRRLTGVASRIEAGDSGLRAFIPGEDEVAALGSAFDSMIDAVAEQAAALQVAADDETRLRNRMEAVVAGMSDGLVAVDMAGRITDFNLAAAVMTDVDQAAALGRPAAKVVSLANEDGTPFRSQIFVPRRLPWARIGILRASNGARIPVAVSGGALRGPSDELVGTVLVFRDLRREHEVEEMKTQFLSRVGHELRTPLTPINAFSELLLLREVPGEKRRDFLKDILASGKRLLRIVEMLEFFAASGAGRMTMRSEPVEIGPLVNAITSSWPARLPDNLSLGRKVARDVPAVAGDKRWLEFAINELVDNAVKFSRQTGGRILVSVSRVPAAPANGRAASGEAVEISVKDSGIGITPEQMAEVFEPFFQVDASDTRPADGLGLGLSLAQRVVEGHGGTLTCISRSGRGSTFSIRIPLARKAGGRTREPAATLPRSRPRPPRTSPT